MSDEWHRHCSVLSVLAVLGIVAVAETVETSSTSSSSTWLLLDENKFDCEMSNFVVVVKKLLPLSQFKFMGNIFLGLPAAHDVVITRIVWPLCKIRSKVRHPFWRF